MLNCSWLRLPLESIIGDTIAPPQLTLFKPLLPLKVELGVPGLRLGAGLGRDIRMLLWSLLMFALGDDGVCGLCFLSSVWVGAQGLAAVSIVLNPVAASDCF